MVDTLVWLLAKLQRHDYQGFGDHDEITRSGANKLWLWEREDGSVLSLQFTAANRGGTAAIGKAKIAFQRRVTGGPVTLGKAARHSVTLEENGHEAVDCYTPTPVKVAESGYLILTIYTFLSLDRWLADEAPNHGKFPGTIAAIDAPKVGELGVRATGPDSYQRYNGVFKDGVLVRGSKTIHGYEAHLNDLYMINLFRPVKAIQVVQF